MSQTIYCRISGIPLISITNLSGGVWPLVTKFEHNVLHPLYEVETETLIAKLKNLCNQASLQSYNLSENSAQQLQLTMSAVLYRMGCLALAHGKPAGLPGTGILIGSAEPLLDIASWHLKLVKKPALPKYRPANAWMNFSAWIESAKQIKDDWHAAKKTAEDKLEDALNADRDIRKVYQKLDSKKVFNWITEQCKHEVPIGRLATMQSLFCADIVNPLEWLSDDVDDITEVVSKYCDPSHDIIHYVMTRCHNIRETIREYNSGFTLLTSTDAPSKLLDNPEQLARETDAINNTMRELREAAENLTEKPVPPSRSQYPKLIDWLKAQAEYNMLVKLYTSRSASI